MRLSCSFSLWLRIVLILSVGFLILLVIAVLLFWPHKVASRLLLFIIVGLMGFLLSLLGDIL